MPAHAQVVMDESPVVVSEHAGGIAEEDEVRGYEDNGGGTPGAQYGPSTGSHAWYVDQYELRPLLRPLPTAQPLRRWPSFSR